MRPALSARFRLTRLALGLGLAGVLSACTDAPTVPEPTLPTLLSLQARLVGSGSDLPINRIVIHAREAATDLQVGSVDRPVVPTDLEWSITLQLDLVGSVARDVVLAIELMNTEGATSTVVWSGLTVVSVRPGSSQEAASAELYPGPLAPIRTISIAPARAFVGVGSSLTLMGEARDDQDNLLTRQFTWTSSDSTKASVSSTGVVNGRAAGDVTITASAEGKHARASITVYVPAADSLVVEQGADQRGTVDTQLSEPLEVAVVDQHGHAVQGHAVQWVVTAGSGRVSPAEGSTDQDGVAQALWTLGPEPGVQTVEARATGLNGSPAVLTATALGTTVESVTVAPADDTLTAGDTLTLTATARDAVGNELPDVAVAWSSSDVNVAKVDGQGEVTGLRAGTATLSATASGKTGTATVTVVPGPAAVLYKFGGDGQSAQAGTAVSAPVVVEVLDRGGNPVSGVEVDWAVLTGGGSVSDTTSVTDGSGRASVEWTLGSAVGIQTLQVTSAGLAGSPGVFTATATGPTGVFKTWVGGDAAAPNDWADFNNWSPVGVPGQLDTVLVPATAPNQPQASGDVTVGKLTVEAGATLDNGGYTVTVLGDVDLPGFVGGAGHIAMTGNGATVHGHTSGLRIEGSVTLDGDVVVDGMAWVIGGSLTPAQWSLTVGGDLEVDGGTLTMADQAGQVVVGGSVSFADDDQTGKLSAGTITVAGNFAVQCYNSTEFVPSGTAVVMDGTAPQTVAIDCGGANGSRFYDLLIASGAQVSTASNPLFIAHSLDVSGTFTVASGGLVDVAGPAGSLFIRSGGVLVNNGAVTANLPISNSGTVSGNTVIQR